jgi:cytochrome c biogenesis protein
MSSTAHPTQESGALRGAVRGGVRIAVRPLASPRWTLVGFAALGATVVATQFDARVDTAWLVAPLALLAANLAAAMAMHRALRRGGLGVFHAALLLALALAALGRLLHFDGRVEVTEGGLLDGAAIEVTSAGPWHGDGWRSLQFEQGPIVVDYAPGLKRARTVSNVVRSDGSRAAVGDTVPLVQRGYHFYTTHNKGFAPLIAFNAPGEAPQRGALHMPSYPLFDWKQQQSWRAPAGTEFRFWLRPAAAADEQSRWRFDPAHARAMLVVEVGTQRAELHEGEAMAGEFGVLRYERLAGWMGYRVSHDATLMPLFACALIGIGGLGWHLLRTRGAMARRGLAHEEIV